MISAPLRIAFAIALAQPHRSSWMCRACRVGGRRRRRVSPRARLTAAQSAIKAGATKDTLVMQVKTDDLGWMFQPAFFASLYDELTATK